MKKTLALILAVIMITALAVSCGGDKTAETSSQTESAVSSKVQSRKPVVVSGAQKREEDRWYTDTVEFTQADLDKALSTKYVKPKNVIVMIGDGMGLNDITLCNKFSDFKFDFGLVIDHLPNQGTCTTKPATNSVTDSAASATALATGVKTFNGNVGVDPNNKPIKNICEYARESGKRYGLVTTDSITGATPCAFALHDPSRTNSTKLALSYLDALPDVLIGGGYNDFFTAAYGDPVYKDKFKNSINLAPDLGSFELMLNSKTKKDMPFFGFAGFPSKSGDYSLAKATQVALKRLENENGFFVMIENAGTDGAGHSNDAQAKVDNVACFDKAIAVAVRYCTEHPDTVLIITSDHETGGVTLPEGEDYALDKKLFTTTNHSGKKVGVFALGYGTEQFNGVTVDNTDIAKFTISAVTGELK